MGIRKSADYARRSLSYGDSHYTAGTALGAAAGGSIGALVVWDSRRRSSSVQRSRGQGRLPGTG